MLVTPRITQNLQGRKQKSFTFLLENKRAEGSPPPGALGQRPAATVHLEQSPGLLDPAGPRPPSRRWRPSGGVDSADGTCRVRGRSWGAFFRASPAGNTAAWLLGFPKLGQFACSWVSGLWCSCTWSWRTHYSAASILFNFSPNLLKLRNCMRVPGAVRGARWEKRGATEGRNGLFAVCFSLRIFASFLSQLTTCCQSSLQTPLAGRLTLNRTACC